MNDCPICGSAFKQVPAGISKKTGKPYNAFISCSKMGCPGKPQGQQVPQHQNVPQNAPTGQNKSQNSPVNWDLVNKKKENGMNWLNAKNNACLIASKTGLGQSEIKKYIKDLAEHIYSLEAPKDLKERIAEHPVMGNQPHQTPTYEVLPVEEQPIEDYIPF